MWQKLLFFTLVAIWFLSTGCASITGGSSYYASIVVNAKPDAEIEYQGQVIGKGKAMIKVRRARADRVLFTIREENCEPHPVFFNSKSFRTGALIGDLFIFGLFGVLIDGISGAFYMPDKNDFRVQKMGISSFLYLIDVPDCQPIRKKEKAAEEEKNIISTITLFDGKIFTGKILENNPGNYIKVQLLDKSIKTIDSEQIIDISGGE
jgi:hypothetical protein